MTEIEDLKRKIKAREGQRGYDENVKHLKRKLEEMEAANGR